jgi:hypothetical protein
MAINGSSNIKHIMQWHLKGVKHFVSYAWLLWPEQRYPADMTIKTTFFSLMAEETWKLVWFSVDVGQCGWDSAWPTGKLHKSLLNN